MVSLRNSDRPLMTKGRDLVHTTGGFTMTEKAMRRLLKIHNEIVHPEDTTPLEDMFHGPDDGGFAVGAVQGDWKTIEAHQLDDDEIFYNIVKEAYERFPMCALGAWLSVEGQIIFDPILIVNDFTEAEYLAKENKQIAVYDFRMQETVWMAGYLEDE